MQNREARPVSMFHIWNASLLAACTGMSVSSVCFAMGDRSLVGGSLRTLCLFLLCCLAFGLG